MSDKRLRIGFVGVGGMGQCAHLKNYAVLDECEVAALAELRPDVRQKVAERYGVPKAYGDHGEMLAAEKLDGIVASQPFSRHGVLVPELLEAGVPVFTEKPLAASIEVGERIVDAVRKSGTWMMIGYNKRSDPGIMFAKAEIGRLEETGELGEMKYVRITMPPGDWIQGGFDDLIRGDAPAGALEYDPPASDMDEKAFGEYKAFVNYYIHQVNLMRHLMGEPYEVKYADPAGVILAALSQGGVAGCIEMSPYNTTVDWRESALVCFEKGYVRIDLAAPLAASRASRVEILRDPGSGGRPETVAPDLPWVSSMRQQAANFLAALRGEKEPLCGPEEALEDLKVARDYLRLLRGV